MTLNKCPRCRGKFAAAGDVCDDCKAGRHGAVAVSGVLRSSALAAAQPDGDVVGAVLSDGVAVLSVPGSEAPFPSALTASVDRAVDEYRAAMSETMRTMQDAGRDPVDVLRAAAADPDATARAAAAAHPECPADVMRSLAGDRMHVVRLAVARNGGCPPEVLASMAHPAASNGPQILCALADNPSLPGHGRERLYAHDDRRVRDRASAAAEAQAAERRAAAEKARGEADERRAVADDERRRVARPVTEESFAHGDRAVAWLRENIASAVVTDRQAEVMASALDAYQAGVDAARQAVREDGVDGNELHAEAMDTMFSPLMPFVSEGERATYVFAGQAMAEVADHAQGRTWGDDENGALSDADREALTVALGERSPWTGYTAVAVAALSADPDGGTGLRGRVAAVMRGREDVPGKLFEVLDGAL